MQTAWPSNDNSLPKREREIMWITTLTQFSYLMLMEVENVLIKSKIVSGLHFP